MPRPLDGSEKADDSACHSCASPSRIPVLTGSKGASLSGGVAQQGKASLACRFAPSTPPTSPGHVSTLVAHGTAGAIKQRVVRITGPSLLQLSFARSKFDPQTCASSLVVVRRHHSPCCSLELPSCEMSSAPLPQEARDADPFGTDGR